MLILSKTDEGMKTRRDREPSTLAQRPLIRLESDLRKGKERRIHQQDFLGRLQPRGEAFVEEVKVNTGVTWNKTHNPPPTSLPQAAAILALCATSNILEIYSGSQSPTTMKY